MAEPILIEVCVDSVISAVAAERGGAARVELCSSLVEGGVTPSAGMIEWVRREISIPIYVMIRPRSGDFFYSPEEFEIMRRDVLTAKELKADGVVFGILKEDGNVDTARTRTLVELARPLSTTFHRAFDMCADLNRALEDLISAGVDRLLTSGGEQNAEGALPGIADLVALAKGRIAVMVGGGIREANVSQIIKGTGTREIHANVGFAIPSPMRHRNNKISLGAIKDREYQRMIVLPERVRRLVEAASSAPALSPSSAD